MKAIYTKLLSIQSELGVIKKDETASVPTKSGGRYDYKYFDINALIAFVKPYLVKNKLVLTQPLSFVGDKGAIRTILFDVESGESIEDVTPLTYNEDPQKMGSAITYYRRYAIQSLFLLEAEDDDGYKASAPVAKQQTYAKPAPAPKVKSFVLDGYEYFSGIGRTSGNPFHAMKVAGTEKEGLTFLKPEEYDQAFDRYQDSI